MNHCTILIVGPGAMGGLLACHLQAGGVAVALLDHDAQRAARLNVAGLRLTTADGDTLCPVRVTAHPSDWDAPRWLVLCVKRFQTPAALRLARPLLGPDTTIVSLQNGMGYESELLAAADDARVLCAVTAMGATPLAEGHLLSAGRGLTSVAAWRPPAQPRAEAFAALLAQAGIETAVHVNATGMLWSKLIINAAINPVTALAGVPNGAILGRPDLRATAHAAAREGAAVAAARGIELDYPDAARRVDEVCTATATNRSSMLVDVTRRRPTEIEFINGALIRAGRQSGIPTPVNAQLAADILNA